MSQISTDKERLDVTLIHQYLSNDSYWAKGRDLEVVKRSIEHSLCFGMLFGKYGANWGLKWWIYYTIPMLMNVLLPPVILQMNKGRTFLYLLLSAFSAPLIHMFFSVGFGWTEYMPFWKICLPTTNGTELPGINIIFSFFSFY